MLKEKNTKKTILKNILILIIILSSFSSTSFAETSETIAESNFDEENIGEVIEEIKNLDKNDVKNIWNELDNIKIKREKEKVVKVPITEKLINYTKISLLWLCNQIMNLKISIVVLIILYSILIYLKKRKKSRGK